jgi:hypothetical protein
LKNKFHSVYDVFLMYLNVIISERYFFPKLNALSGRIGNIPVLFTRGVAQGYNELSFQDDLLNL